MQSEFFKMDVFFIIASVFSVIIGTIVCLILWKIYRLIGEVDQAKENIKSFIYNWINKLKK